MLEEPGGEHLSLIRDARVYKTRGYVLEESVIVRF